MSKSSSDELDEILAIAGIPKGIHRVGGGKYLGADRYSPENMNKVSSEDTFTEAKQAILNLIDTKVNEARIDELDRYYQKFGIPMQLRTNLFTDQTQYQIDRLAQLKEGKK